MDLFQSLTIALGVFSLVVSGFGFIIWSKIDKASNDAEQAKKDAAEKSEAVKDDLAQFKLHVAREHPLKDELASMANKMDAGFKAIFEKFDLLGRDLNGMGDTFRNLLNDKQDKQK